MSPPCEVSRSVLGFGAHARPPERALSRGPGRGRHRRRAAASGPPPRGRWPGRGRTWRSSTATPRASPTPRRQIGLEGGEALAFTNDVTDAFAVERTFDRVAEEWGRLDVLVNNAGVLKEASLDELTDEDFQETLDVNLRGAMVCARAAVPHMLKQGRGRILSAASGSTRLGSQGLTAYAAAKAGVVGMTRTWARELGPKGITANAVAPGLIDSETVRTVPADELDADARPHPRPPARHARGGGRGLPLPGFRPRVVHQRRGGRGRRGAAAVLAGTGGLEGQGPPEKRKRGGAAGVSGRFVPGALLYEALRRGIRDPSGPAADPGPEGASICAGAMPAGPLAPGPSS